jgi:intron-binding protein aquarius
MIVGPPGTGKTDVAVQIIANLYHNFPKQKIVVCAHSNAALNDIFEKIREKGVNPGHLLRLGSGEKSLAGSEDFSKQGRVNWSLARRLQLLEQVQRLAVSLGVQGDFGSSCETASYFRQEQVLPRIEKFDLDVKTSAPRDVFPFGSFFNVTTTSLFSGDISLDLAASSTCISHIEKVFAELEDYRSFELILSQGQRGDYLLQKQVRHTQSNKQ